MLILKAQGAEDEAMWAADKYVLFATKDGTVKKTSLSSYANIRSNGLIALNIEEGNRLVSVLVVPPVQRARLVVPDPRDRLGRGRTANWTLRCRWRCWCMGCSS
ncbi:MAG: DNA gyrase C-terminal beta-propeller domain-containing protein [bacterium]